MFPARPVFLALAFILFFVSACMPAFASSQAPPTVAQLAILPSATIPPAITAQTDVPANTATLPPTYTPKPTATQPPTKQVSKPTATATPVPPCTTNGTITNHILNSDINGQMAFQIYLPPCYGQDGRVYPTIYLLHGNGQSEALWDRLGVDEVGNAGILQQTLPPFIMVMPRGGWAHTNSSGGVGSYEDVIMNELIPHIENNFCAWDTRYGRAIGGISRGGYWALEVAFRNPMAFASVGGHSAALLDLVAGPNLNPQYTGIDNNLGDLRVYLDVGEIDWGSRTNLERLHEDMGNAGISHQWLLNEGGHNEPYWTAHVPEYLTWYTEIWSKNRASYPVCE